MEKLRLPVVHAAYHYRPGEGQVRGASRQKWQRYSCRRSAAAKFGTNRSTCEVEVAAKPKYYYCQMNMKWPSKLVYAGSHCLGISTLELKDIIRPLCNDGRNAPWNPDEPTGVQTKLDSRASSRGTRDGRYARSSGVYEAGRVTTDDTVRLEHLKIK